MYGFPAASFSSACVCEAALEKKRRINSSSTLTILSTHLSVKSLFLHLSLSLHRCIHDSNCLLDFLEPTRKETHSQRQFLVSYKVGGIAREKEREKERERERERERELDGEREREGEKERERYRERER